MVSRYNCFLCGVGIYKSSVTESQDWLCEYRAGELHAHRIRSRALTPVVYRKGPDALVSGVAHYRNSPEWVMPVDPSLRWDTATSSDELMVPPVMDQAARDGLHGFVLHDACWRLLQKADGASAFSPERLVKVCESLPFPFWFHGLNWGHDYGGRLELDTKLWHPWKETFRLLDGHALKSIGALGDPFRVPDLASLLSGPREDVPSLNTPIDPGGRHDDFSRLPWELREMIIVSLGTKDALNLRQASWSFQSLFSSRAFWLSRFDPDCESGFLFEAREKAVASDICALLYAYRFSRRNASSPCLWNRHRVWTLARRLLPLIRPPVMTNTLNVQLDPADSEGWTSLSSGVYIPDSPASSELWASPRYSTTTTEVEVPLGPVIIGIAMVNTGIWDYITGIRIVSSNGGEEHFAGYLFDSGETLCNVAALHGFRVAMGPHGVRALQVVGTEQETCSWVGRIRGVPISERLLVEEPVNRLRVTLDVSQTAPTSQRLHPLTCAQGYKITALSIYYKQLDSKVASQSIDMSFRRAAIWYPDPPPDDLILNASSFTGLSPDHNIYQPLSWIHFGGQRGRNLAHVQGIRVLFHGSLCGLQFVYDCEVPETGALTSERFGRCGETPSERASLFSIDGAGGERISSISVGLYVFERDDLADYHRHGIVRYLKVRTPTAM